MKHLTIAFAIAAAILFPAAAQASTYYDDETDFHAQGVISHVIGFSSYDEENSTYLNSTTYTDGDVTLSSTAGLVVIAKHNAGHDFAENAIGPVLSDYDLEIDFDQPGYDLFSFNFGNYAGSTEAVSVWIYTNSGFDAAFGLTPYLAEDGFRFRGIKAPDGEYFTKIVFSPNGDFHGVGYSQFELGYTGEPPCINRVCDVGDGVPEPSTWALMLLGFGGMGAAFRVRRRALAVTS